MFELVCLITFDTIKLVDFNDLFVIAVGLSMAYVVFEGKQQSSFFHILSRITDTLKNWVLERKTKPQQDEEAVITKINYYLNSGLLSTETKGALTLVSEKAKEVVDSVHNLESWSEEKLKFHTKTDFLSIISYDCFLFGIFVLFVGVFQNKCNLSIAGLLEIMLLALFILLIHCLCFERMEINRRWKRIFSPGFILHTLIFITALIFGVVYNTTIPVFFSEGVLSVSSVIACFIGFIAYLLTNILSNFILAIIILVKIFKLKISDNAKNHNSDLKRYNDELDAIDGTLNKEDLTDNIKIKK